MDVFAIDDGFCGSGPGRYAGGVLTLPDGSAHGVETLLDIQVHDDRPGLQRTTGSLAGSLRDALGGARNPLPLPLRLAVSGVRAGLGAIEEGLNRAEGVRAHLVFAQGRSVAALVRPELVELMRRDAALIRAALERRPAGPLLIEHRPADVPREPLRIAPPQVSEPVSEHVSPRDPEQVSAQAGLHAGPQASPQISEQPPAAPAAAPPSEPTEPVEAAASEAGAEAGTALTSIFRYEKRNGRLRRVQVTETDTQT